MTKIEAEPYRGSDDDERLNYMASRFANAVTLKHLIELGVNSGDTVLDLGSGPNTSLGDEIKTTTNAHYLALDANPTSVRTQISHGHNAIEASMTDIPIKSNSISVINARFSMSWLSGRDRSHVWNEIVRVGQPDFRGVITDYDWSVVDGPPHYTALISSMRTILTGMGFRPDHGQTVLPEVNRIFAPYRAHGVDIFTTGSCEEIPAQDADEKHLMIEATAKSIIAILRTSGNNLLADDILEKLKKTSTEDGNDFILPNIHSAIFSLNTIPFSAPRLQKYSEGLSFRAPQEKSHNLPPIVRLTPDEHSDSLAVESRKLFAKTYLAAGYVTGEGVDTSQKELLLNENTDPTEVRKRSEIFVATNDANQVVSSVRLIHSKDSDVTSLPVGQKIVAKYGKSILPEDIRRAGVAEISAFVSQGGNPLISVQLLAALVESARQSNIKYLLFGATSGVPSNVIGDHFGDAMNRIKIDGDDATVTVTGPGYRREGIMLDTAYFNTDTFYKSMIDYYQNGSKNHREAVIALCTQLETAEQGH